MQYEIILNIHDGIKIYDIYGKVKYNIYSTTTGINFLILFNSRITYFDGYKIGIMDLRNEKVNFYNLDMRMIKGEIYEENVEQIKYSIYSKIYGCDIPSKDKLEYRMLIGKEINTPLNKNLLNIVYLYLGI